MRIPKIIVQSGDRKATGLVSFNLMGTWGNVPSTLSQLAAVSNYTP